MIVLSVLSNCPAVYKGEKRLVHPLTNHDISGTIKPTDLKFGSDFQTVRRVSREHDDPTGGSFLKLYAEIRQHGIHHSIQSIIVRRNHVSKERSRNFRGIHFLFVPKEQRATIAHPAIFTSKVHVADVALRSQLMTVSCRRNIWLMMKANDNGARLPHPSSSDHRDELNYGAYDK
ncbi:hypothetical protein TNCV_2316831 [Trichonephila clavipes]|nr:hypothetical protein TNCV_2316831 [Trichonephila clavipes]